MRKPRFEPEHLVEGLTFDERLARLESHVMGNSKVLGLMREHDETRRKVEDLESTERRRKLPFYLRWFLPKPGDNRSWKERKTK